jgi:zinc transporter, ZIP family
LRTSGHRLALDGDAAVALLPWGLGLAAGAILHVVVSELISDARAMIGGGR